MNEETDILIEKDLKLINTGMLQFRCDGLIS